MNLSAIRNATLDARVRLRDNTIGTRVENGRLQLIRVTYDRRGVSTVAPFSDWLPLLEAVDALNALIAA